MRAFHWADWIGNLFFVQELVLKYHVDINGRENNGSTALGEARRENYPANVKNTLKLNSMFFLNFHSFVTL